MKKVLLFIFIFVLGFLLGDFESRDIKKKIENVLRSKEKQKKLIKNGFKRIKKFSWKKCTYETTQVYKRIIT